MTPQEFEAWLDAMELTKAGAARVLGLKPKTVAAYCSGVWPNGAKSRVPEPVRILCLLLLRLKTMHATAFEGGNGRNVA